MAKNTLSAFNQAVDKQFPIQQVLDPTGRPVAELPGLNRRAAGRLYQVEFTYRF